MNFSNHIAQNQHRRFWVNQNKSNSSISNPNICGIRYINIYTGLKKVTIHRQKGSDS